MNIFPLMFSLFLIVWFFSICITITKKLNNLIGFFLGKIFSKKFKKADSKSAIPSIDVRQGVEDSPLPVPSHDWQ